MPKPQILIVEDEALVAKDIENTLRKLGYSVTAPVSSAHKAMEKAREHRPDLVLMDIQLDSDMDGIDAATQIRRQLGIPVVYLTAYADEQTLKRARISEPFGYLVKPFDERQLQTTIEIALYRHDIDSRILGHQKMEAVGKLASSVVHDFSNILRVISGHASDLVASLLPGTEAHKAAERILESARHAGNLTKRILTLARASGTETDIRIEPVSLSALIRDAVALVEKSFADKGIVFKIKNLDRMPMVMADSARIFDALMDLFLNAAEAMPKGGTIGVHAAEKDSKYLNLPPNPYAKPGRYVALSVRDTGIGMTPDIRKRVFEPFFTTKSSSGNIGLGLTVVQSTVTRHGGHIRVLSKPGKGSCFRIYLPRAKGIVAKAAKPTTDIPAGITVLVVDDDAALLRESEAILQKEGLRVLTACGGDAGIETYRRHADKIGVSIVDVIMPGRSGKEVLDTISETDPTASVIMTSGFSREHLRTVLAPGPWVYLQKPYGAEQLIGAVRRVLAAKTS